MGEGVGAPGSGPTGSQPPRRAPVPLNGPGRLPRVPRLRRRVRPVLGEVGESPRSRRGRRSRRPDRAAGPAGNAPNFAPRGARTRANSAGPQAAPAPQVGTARAGRVLPGTSPPRRETSARPRGRPSDAARERGWGLCGPRAPGKFAPVAREAVSGDPPRVRACCGPFPPSPPVSDGRCAAGDPGSARGFGVGGTLPQGPDGIRSGVPRETQSPLFLSCPPKTRPPNPAASCFLRQDAGLGWVRV